MLGFLGNAGFQLADRPEVADLIIVNTCGFIESAAEESVDIILEMADLRKGGACRGLIVAGCLYQRYGDGLRKEMPEVDAFVGCGALKTIAKVSRDVLDGAKLVAAGPPDYLYDHRTPRAPLKGTASVYVKIAEGCDNRCTYCTIPSIRGRYRSRSVESVVKETRELVRRGAKEINLVAQDTTYFGVPETGDEQLTQLLRQLDGIRGKKWVRLLYLHPARVTNAVARAIDDSRSVCHYVDVPIQHICDTILHAMGRRCTSDDIRRAIDILRAEIDDVALRTTLMVGFPGETDRHFEKMLEFVREVKFDRLGAFMYSREQGTAAARLRRHVPREVKEERYEALMQEQLTISDALNRSHIGTIMEVFVESVDESLPNTVIGRTYRDAPEVDGFVRVSCKITPPVGEFIQARITAPHGHDLEGKML